MSVRPKMVVNEAVAAEIRAVTHKLTEADEAVLWVAVGDAMVWGDSFIRVSSDGRLSLVPRRLTTSRRCGYTLSTEQGDR
jgi:hypothetical protein